MARKSRESCDGILGLLYIFWSLWKSCQSVERWERLPAYRTLSIQSGYLSWTFVHPKWNYSLGGISCQETTKHNNEVRPQNQESSIQLPNNIPGPSTASTCMASTSKSKVGLTVTTSPLPTTITRRQRESMQQFWRARLTSKNLRKSEPLMWPERLEKVQELSKDF